MKDRVEQRLDDHIRESERCIHEMQLDIKIIKENHLSHMEKDIAIIKTKLEMLTKFFWMQMAVMITGLGGMFFALIKLV